MAFSLALVIPVVLLSLSDVGLCLPTLGFPLVNIAGVDTADSDLENFDMSAIDQTLLTDTKAVFYSLNCPSPVPNITLNVGDGVLISSSNFPNNYAAFEQCSWDINTAPTNEMRIACLIRHLPFGANINYVDDGETFREYCWGNNCTTSIYTFKDNEVKVNFNTFLWFTGPGFYCGVVARGKTVEAKLYQPNCKCGVKGTDSKIINGTVVKDFEYGWMALLTRPGATSNFCGGSLISATFVLTAAHCTINQEASNIDVRLGVNQKSSTSSNEFRSPAQEIINHPQYNSATSDYDVSVIRILEVDFEKYTKISTICLPSGSLTYEGEDAIVAGWGTTQTGGSTSNDLLEVTVPVKSNAECSQNYANQNGITAQMMCAGKTDNDSCQGDSGGPLFFEEALGFYEEIGIVSWGVTDYPGVYTRVTAVRSWIDEVIEGSKMCSKPTSNVG